MRESRTYGSVRGARDETRVPTATLPTGLRPTLEAGRPRVDAPSLRLRLDWFVSADAGVAVLSGRQLSFVCLGIGQLRRSRLGDRHSVRDGYRLVAGELRAAAPSRPTTANGLMARSTGRFPGQGRKSAMRCAFTSLELWSRQRVSFCAKAVAKT
jgi:hypothetical protein